MQEPSQVSPKTKISLGFNTEEHMMIRTPPGVYRFRVMKLWEDVSAQGTAMIWSRLAVVTDGAAKGRTILQSFNKDHFLGQHAFSKFIHAATGKHFKEEFTVEEILNKEFYGEVYHEPDKANPNKVYERIKDDSYQSVADVEGAGAPSAQPSAPPQGGGTTADETPVFAG